MFNTDTMIYWCIFIDQIWDLIYGLGEVKEFVSGFTGWDRLQRKYLPQKAAALNDPFTVSALI